MSLRLAAEIVFWLSAAALLYTYIGYPLLLMLMARLRPRAVRARADWTPSVTFIITAYNEERDLAAKLENTLALDYPKESLEIIVASDCSTDRTDEIVRSFARRGVRLHRQRERLGKTAAQNAAVELANGEIILFSDATTLYQPDVLRVLMPCFADPTVGCATGRVVYTDQSATSVGHGTRSYWSYEFLLRKNESTVCSLIGVCGCMYAVRRSAYVPLYHEACSDFIIATKMVEQNLRAVYEPAAVCMEETNEHAGKELKTRVRIITQTFADLWRNRAMMNPFRSGFYAVQLLSHKVMRYLVPLFLILILAASATLAAHSIYFAIILAGQLCVYGVATLAWMLERIGVHSRLLALPQYFVLGNLASLIAFYKFLSGERYARWEPIRAGGATPLAQINSSPHDEELANVADERVGAR
ncbi:MAG TPA: glycosyltransferase family 2 protein [Pyrinomonadaceae bacterium]